MATLGGVCAYGGSSPKPYPNGTNNKFRDNVFQRGPTGWSEGGQRVCGYYRAVDSVAQGVRGNEWVNNKYDDGSAVPSN